MPRHHARKLISECLELLRSPRGLGSGNDAALNDQEIPTTQRRLQLVREHPFYTAVGFLHVKMRASCDVAAKSTQLAARVQADRHGPQDTGTG